MPAIETMDGMRELFALGVTETHKKQLHGIIVVELRISRCKPLLGRIWS
jgi:hypothetical protein